MLNVPLIGLDSQGQQQSVVFSLLATAQRFIIVQIILVYNRERFFGMLIKSPV